MLKSPQVQVYEPEKHHKLQEGLYYRETQADLVLDFQRNKNFVTRFTIISDKTPTKLLTVWPEFQSKQFIFIRFFEILARAKLVDMVQQLCKVDFKLLLGHLGWLLSQGGFLQVQFTSKVKLPLYSSPNSDPFDISHQMPWIKLQSIWKHWIYCILKKNEMHHT